MARGSPSDRKRQRALDELAGFDKAIRRGQRPAVLTVVAVYLELPVADRPTYFEFVQRLVGKALDELQTRPPPPNILMTWSGSLQAAPELVKGHDEPAEVAFERWWTLLRTAISRRLNTMAEHFWVHLAPATRERAPALAQLVEEWIGKPGGPTDDRLGLLRVPLEALLSRGQPVVAELDPRLGVEPVSRQRESLSAEASRDEVRAWVETVFAQKTAVLPRLRGAVRSLPRDRQAWLSAEAAPFLLREALARDSVEHLSGFAEVLSNTTEPLAAELEMALRWAYTINAAHPSLFPRFALLALARDPSSFDRITSALFTLGIDHERFTAELCSLLTALLRHQKPTAKLWSWAIAFVPPDPEVDHDELTEVLLAALPALMEAPSHLAETLSRMDAKDCALVIDFIAAFGEPPTLEAFLRALWPLANDLMRRNLAEAFDTLVERHNQLARPKLDGSRTPIPYSLERRLWEYLDMGGTPEDSVETVLEDVPPPLDIVLRKPLLELARQGPPPPAAASRALWAEFGEAIVVATPFRLHDAFFYVKDTETRLSFIESAFAEHQTVEGWVNAAHRIASLIEDPSIINPYLTLVQDRFGDTVETWRVAHGTQHGCSCLYSLGVALRLLFASVKAGVDVTHLVRELRATFPHPYAQERIALIIRGHKPKAKRGSASKAKAGQNAKRGDEKAAEKKSKKAGAEKAERVKPETKKAKAAAAKADNAKPAAEKASKAKAGAAKAGGAKAGAAKAGAAKAEKAKSATEKATKAKKPTTKEVAQRTAKMGQVIRDLFD